MSEQKVSWEEMIPDLRIVALRTPGSMSAGMRSMILDAINSRKDNQTIEESLSAIRGASRMKDKLIAAHQAAYPAKWQ